MKIYYQGHPLQLTYPVKNPIEEGYRLTPKIDFRGGPFELLRAYLTSEQMREYVRPRLGELFNTALEFKQRYEKLTTQTLGEDLALQVDELRGEMLLQVASLQHELFGLIWQYAIANAEANKLFAFTYSGSPEFNELTRNIRGCLTALSQTHLLW